METINAHFIRPFAKRTINIMGDEDYEKINRFVSKTPCIVYVAEEQSLMFIDVKNDYYYQINTEYDLKELLSTVTELTTQVNELQKANESLESRISTLEKTVNP